MVASITATADATNGRMTLVAAGLTTADAILIFRRDSGGVLPVRDTSEATVIPVLAGATYGATVYDYEPLQGESTDYLLTDVDGAVHDDTTVTIPTWGTWLKSPGRPYLNTRCYFGGVTAVDRAPRRVLVGIEGSPEPVALVASRLSPSGAVVLQTLTDAQTAAVIQLLSDGQTLMLDTDQSWQVPFRYVSVGTFTETRAYGQGELGLERLARTHTLGDVAAVDMPVGVSLLVAGVVYDDLPVAYGSYAALAADNATYVDLLL